MNILVVNGSPRGEDSNTKVLTDAFLAGAAEAGASAETVYLKGKHIEHCCGDFHCWLRTPGVCIHKDDMPELLEKMHNADMVVFASPLYIYTVTGMMKDFMDRMLPLADPHITVDSGTSDHPRRYENGPKQYVLISNCGFPEQDHFSGLKETFRRCFRGEAREISGMICCAGGETLRNPALGEGIQWYLDAVRQAGKEVTANGRISPETQAVIDRPLIEDQHAFAEMANAYFDSVLAGVNQAPSEPSIAANGEPLPPPMCMDTVRDVVAGMAMVFDSKAAGDTNAVIQFDITDEAPGDYYVEIANGKCAAYAGQHPKPSATIITPSAVWLGIARGEINGATAFVTGKYKVKGDMMLLMKMEKLFPAGK